MRSLWEIPHTFVLKILAPNAGRLLDDRWISLVARSSIRYFHQGEVLAIDVDRKEIGNQYLRIS
jgi:hypothetical protein